MNIKMREMILVNPKLPATIGMSIFLFMVFMSCATVPIEGKDAVSGVRYWKKDTAVIGRKAMTVSAEDLADHDIPLRDAPKIVILMYHNLVFGRTGNEYNRDIYNFEHDLAFLRKRFKIIDFTDLRAIWEGKIQLTSDAALVTFDDGDLSMYAIAYPLLSEYGISATFFIISDFVGQTGYMNWAQIREMAQYSDASGRKLFTMGSHGVSHQYLGEVGQDILRTEFVASKAAIEGNTGLPVGVLALPFGSGAGRQEIVDLAKEVGYTAIRTSDNRFVLADKLDLFRLPGIYIDNLSTDKVMGKIWAMIGR